MKDEKYNDEMVYPLIKIIYTRPSNINHPLEEHYHKKLSALKLLGLKIAGSASPKPHSLF